MTFAAQSCVQTGRQQACLMQDWPVINPVEAASHALQHCMQANLGMKRCKQCEELLALAAWLLYSEPEHALPLMKAQLKRLYGQLHALMGRSAPLALTPHAFKCVMLQQHHLQAWAYCTPQCIAGQQQPS